MSKVCLVIGGTGGLGSACAEVLAGSGYKVVVAGRNKEKGGTVVNKIQAAGGVASFSEVNIIDPASIKALHEGVVAKYGRLDAAVNAAGVIGGFGLLHESKAEDIASTLQNNLTAVIMSMQEQIRLMKSNPGGSGGKIVNFSSIYGLHGCKRGSVYSATKHAIIGLTKSAALEYSNPKDNILINAIAPGIVVTEMTAILADPSVLPEGEVKDDLMSLPKQYPMGRFGHAAEVANAVKFLVESPYTTGTVLEIDGGFGAK